MHSAISFGDESFLLDVVRRSQSAATSDAWFCDIKSRCSDTSVEFSVRNGVVCKLIRDHYAPVIPPSDNDLKQLLCLELHAGGLGGHVSFDKMLREAKRRFNWQHVQKDIARFCKECLVC